jgi:hypothetical protein
LVALIDQAVQAAISGEEPTAEILGRAQAAAAVIRL